MSYDAILHEKQKEVLKCFVEEQPKILVASGAKRAGKTYVLTLIYLMHIAQYKNQGLNFILGGATQAAIRRNVLDDMELILGKELKLDKSNAVKIFGNKVYVFDGANSDSWNKVRGFTAAGAFMNEATALHDKFVKEVISRCSVPNAKILMDTNPENPMHTVKVDYIDKSGQRLSNGKLNIKAFQFTLFDNTFLNKEYIESIVASTPSGMFTDRDIYGKWVAAQGVVYPDFKKEVHTLFKDEIKQIRMTEYFAGVDWGFEHHGSIVVIGRSEDDNYYLIEEHAHQHKFIEDWTDIALGIKERYGNIPFYCDTARTEHIRAFEIAGINAQYADKNVLSGIEAVAKLLVENRLYINRDAKRYLEEIYNYVWDSNSDKPVKIFDDVQDAVRYAIYTHTKADRMFILT
ncbi:PBSX family phage terminase large subunit [Macrococcoides bohemicum]|uniref:PBSX family phage terminase large subunit n=1 Tax=Macrococcoides bohemicum TaxID=1903056 RepID=UPI001059E61A|nr:PBSX family phage terminase large subunit [Macrococcus bohemicus]TDL39402.1 PBSX family phage terminase large subunit [Macrococcus bohemicus]